MSGVSWLPVPVTAEPPTKTLSRQTSNHTRDWKPFSESTSKKARRVTGSSVSHNRSLSSIGTGTESTKKKPYRNNNEPQDELNEVGQHHTLTATRSIVAALSGLSLQTTNLDILAQHNSTGPTKSESTHSKSL